MVGGSGMSMIEHADGDEEERREERDMCMSVYIDVSIP